MNNGFKVGMALAGAATIAVGGTAFTSEQHGHGDGNAYRDYGSPRVRRPAQTCSARTPTNASTNLTSWSTRSLTTSRHAPDVH